MKHCDQRARMSVCRLVTEGAAGPVAPGRSRQGSAKEPDQKYFMTNNRKSEFDIVF